MTQVILPRRWAAGGLSALLLALLLAAPAGALTGLSAAEPQAADLLPATTVAYAELSKPGKLVEGLLTHPLVAQAIQRPEAKKAFESPQYQHFRLVLGLVEAQVGMPWRQTLNQIENVYAAGDLKTEGVVVLVHAKNAECLTKLATALLNLARLDAQSKSQPDPIQEGEYRGSKTYSAGPGRAAIRGNWLVVSNVESLWHGVLDNLDSAVGGKPVEASLATDADFKAALAKRAGGNNLAWAWLRLGPLRDHGKLAALKNEKAPDPGAEIVFGGVLSVLGKTPFVTASIRATDDSLKLSVAAPHDATWIRAARNFYFGAASQGAAPPLLCVNDTLGAISIHRDLSALWMASGDLFSDAESAKFEQADSGLSTFFSGKEFGRDILGQFDPGIQIVVARQQFGPDRQPAIKLPAFAVVLGLKEPDKIDRQMRISFQSLIGFLNIVGAQNGLSQLELHSEKRDGGEYNWASYAPGETTPKDPGRLHDNFSPALVVVGKRMVLASTIDLANEIAKLPPTAAAAGDARSNFAVSLNGPAIVNVLRENRQHLVAQNVLEKGNSDQQAGKEVDLALEAGAWLKRASLELGIRDQQLQLEAVLQVSKP